MMWHPSSLPAGKRLHSMFMRNKFVYRLRVDSDACSGPAWRIAVCGSRNAPRQPLALSWTNRNSVDRNSGRLLRAIADAVLTTAIRSCSLGMPGSSHQENQGPSLGWVRGCPARGQRISFGIIADAHDVTESLMPQAMSNRARSGKRVSSISFHV